MSGPGSLTGQPGQQGGGAVSIQLPCIGFTTVSTTVSVPDGGTGTTQLTIHGDHLLYDLPVGARGPWEVWTSLAAIAAATERVELGTLVTPPFFRNPAMLAKQMAVAKLIRVHRVRGHLIADLDPLRWTEPHTPRELDPATYGLTIWDLDREFLTDGVGGVDKLSLGDLLGKLLVGASTPSAGRDARGIGQVHEGTGDEHDTFERRHHTVPHSEEKEGC